MLIARVLIASIHFQVFLTQVKFLVSSLLKEVFSMMTFTLNRKQTKKVKKTLHIILDEIKGAKKAFYHLNMTY